MKTIKNKKLIKKQKKILAEGKGWDNNDKKNIDLIKFINQKKTRR